MKKLKFMKKVGLSLGVFLMAGTVCSLPNAHPVEVEAATVTTYKTTANVNLRSQPNVSSKSLGVVSKGKEVTYVSKSGSWYKVKYGTKTGYISTSYLQKTAIVTPPKAPASSSTIYTTTDSLNLRSGASTKYKTLVTIPKGKTVSMVAYGTSWSKVTYGGKTGYVSTKYLKKSTPSTKPPVVKENNFLSKQESIKLLTDASFTGEKRKVFESQTEYGLTYVHSYMVGATKSAREDYQFVVGEYDSKKLSSMSFIMSRYNKHKSAQKNGMQALELGLSGFFGKGKPETAELTKLVKSNMTYSKDKVVNFSISGKKGLLVVTNGTMHLFFDYNGSLPIIRL